MERPKGQFSVTYPRQNGKRTLQEIAAGLRSDMQQVMLGATLPPTVLAGMRLAMERAVQQSEERIARLQATNPLTSASTSDDVGVPEYVRVGQYTYTVHTDAETGNAIKAADNAEGELLGHSNHSALSIWVDGKLAIPLLAETLLHEVLHACIFHSGSYRPDDEEAYVCAIAPTLFSVLRENPELLSFLTTAGR